MRGRLLFPLVLASIFFALTFIARAEPTLAQQYLDLYVKIHDAENLEKNGDSAGALKAFQEIYDGLRTIHHADPDWEPAIVIHRMDDCKVTIEKLQSDLAQFSPATATSTGAPSDQPASPAPDVAPKTDEPPPAPKNVYPWKIDIITSLFYLGENSMGNAWRIKLSAGSDSPDDRNGYATGSHASSFNPFYVALPFNDLAYPDKAKKYLPAGWSRPDKDGKPVSACKDRWVEIETENGVQHVCYAQWEDVGPGHPDDADYVFGNAKPSDARAGLAVSPAVAQYLGSITKDETARTEWRFVDPEDVPPGAWLKYEEQAVIYTAMHQTKDSDAAIQPEAKK